MTESTSVSLRAAVPDCDRHTLLFLRLSTIPTTTCSAFEGSNSVIVIPAGIGIWVGGTTRSTIRIKGRLRDAFRIPSSVERHGCFGHGLPRLLKNTQSPLPFVWKKILSPHTGHSVGCVSGTPRSHRACPTAHRADAASRAAWGGLTTRGA